MDTRTQELLDDAWGHFLAKRHDAGVMERAIPVPYVGNVDAYSASETRILTTGLNFARAEFPGTDPLAKFPSARGLEGMDDARRRRAHHDALTTYFAREPSSWFDEYRAFINALDADYVPGRARHTALHVDVCSPLATDPDWGGLMKHDPALASSLMEHGHEAFMEKLERFEPHVVIFGIGWRYVSELPGAPTREQWETIARTANKPQAPMLGWRRSEGQVWVFVRSTRKPMSFFTHEERAMLGSALAGWL